MFVICYIYILYVIICYVICHMLICYVIICCNFVYVLYVFHDVDADTFNTVLVNCVFCIALLLIVSFEYCTYLLFVICMS